MPSKTRRPLLPAGVSVAGSVLPPIVRRPVKEILAAVMPAGGTKKSPLLTARPPGGATVRGPEGAPAGTAAPGVGAGALVAIAGARWKIGRFWDGVVSKLVPAMATAVPGTATVGVKLVIVGAPLVAVLVKWVLLVALPPGLVTAIGPVVAAAGTVTVSWVGVAAVTVALVPLNWTVFEAGVALNPVP